MIKKNILLIIDFIIIIFCSCNNNSSKDTDLDRFYDGLVAYSTCSNLDVCDLNLFLCALERNVDSIEVTIFNRKGKLLFNEQFSERLLSDTIYSYQTKGDSILEIFRVQSSFSNLQYEIIKKEGTLPEWLRGCSFEDEIIILDDLN